MNGKMTVSTEKRTIAHQVTGYLSDSDRQLRVLRRIWLPVNIAVVVLFVIAAPVYFDQVKSACVDPDCHSWQRHAQPPGASPSLRFYALFGVVREAITLAIFFILAVFLALRGSNDRMALFGSMVLVIFAGGVIPDSLAALAVTSTFWWISISLLGSIGSIALLLFFCLFPNGRFAPPWTRWVLAAGILFSVFTYWAPETSRFNVYGTLSILVFFVLLTVLAFAQWRRYRFFSTPIEQQQTKWVIFGFGAALSGFIISALVLPMIGPDIIANRTMFRLVGQTIASGFVLLVPISITLGAMKYRLWDIDLFINRALVYGALTACVVGMYVLAVTLIGSLLPASGDTLISLVATGLLAVLFQPLRLRLQRGVNRLLYGERDDPYAVLSRLGERLGASIDQNEVLPTIVETVTQSLRVPYAAIVLKHKDSVESVIDTGIPMGEPQKWPLLYQQERVGELLVSTRGPGESFSSSDIRLLDNLAHQAGSAIHSARLSAELQHSRERLVVAREEERRRLRRDLHDGLGPQLASQTLTLDAARKLMPTNPAAADHLLDELRGHIQSSITDIRKLVYALRPPSLDELGLVGAIRETVRRLEDGTIRFTFEVTAIAAPLPAAVEVAGLRIAQEAITNVVRHSHATNCSIRIDWNEAERELNIEVEDDGVGLASDREIGVGLISMQERATELGGQFDIESPPNGGTWVRAALPVRGER